MLAGLGSTLIPGLEEPSKKRKETKKEGEKEKVNETYIYIYIYCKQTLTQVWYFWVTCSQYLFVHVGLPDGSWIMMCTMLFPSFFFSPIKSNSRASDDFGSDGSGGGPQQSGWRFQDSNLLGGLQNNMHALSKIPISLDSNQTFVGFKWGYFYLISYLGQIILIYVGLMFTTSGPFTSYDLWW